MKNQEIHTLQTTLFIVFKCCETCQIGKSLQLEWTSLIPARKAGLFAVSVLPSAFVNLPDHESQQTKRHPKAPANKAFERKVRNGWHLFCVLDLRVGHTMDALSPFISVLYHSDSTLPRAVLSMSHPGRSWFFLCCPLNPQNLSQSFHLKSAKTCFFILSECPAFTAVHC